MLEVGVSVPVDREDWSDLEHEIRDEFGPEGDTGCGLGYSDTSFPVKSRKEGKSLKQQIWTYLYNKGIPVGDTPEYINDGKTVIVAF